MSKKASIVFLSILTFCVVISLGLLISGLIMITSDVNPSYSLSLSLIISGGVCIFIELVIILITAISSNYMESIKRKKDKSLSTEVKDETIESKTEDYKEDNLK